MDIIMLGLFMIPCFLLALLLTFKPVLEDRKIRNNVVSTDSAMRHYCYTLNCTQSELIAQLSMRNVNDVLEYTFDANRLTIVFSYLGVSMEHRLSFYSVENVTYLKVSRVRFMHSRSNIPLMVNRFFVEKIGAVPVHFIHFESAH